MAMNRYLFAAINVILSLSLVPFFVLMCTLAHLNERLFNRQSATIQFVEFLEHFTLRQMQFEQLNPRDVVMQQY